MSRFRFVLAGPDPERRAWFLDPAPEAVPDAELRRLPRARFLALFAPGRPEGELGAEELEGLPWDEIEVDTWGQVQGLLTGIEGGAWSAFAAEGGRLAAEARMAGVGKSAAPRVNPYGESDLTRGEEIVAEAFAAGGALERLLGEGYEPRAGQAEMALAVWQVLAGGGDLVVEAPTGTGKSLAYLLPAGLFALMSDERVIVATHTRNLQEQLLGRDLPRLVAADWFPLSTALLMGRENYLCRRKLERFIRELGDAPEQRLAAAALLVWRDLSRNGLVDELAENPLIDAPLIAELRARSQGAEESRCAARSDCWVTRARERARAAQLVVVNHSLLLADQSVDGGVLGDYRHLIVDEAQHLESVATRALGVELSARALDAVLGLVAPEARQLRWQRREITRWLPALRELAALRAGVAPKREEFLAGLPALRAGFRDLLDALDQFPIVARAMAAAGRIRYGAEQNLAGLLAVPAEALRKQLGGLARAARELADLAGEGRGEGELRAEGEALTLLSAGLVELGARLDFLLAGAAEDFVFYLEGGAEGRVRQFVASPVEVAPELGSYFRERLDACLLTSATLTVQGDFGYFRSRVGLDFSGREVFELMLDSPFDYEEQARLLLPSYLPDPGHGQHLSRMVALLAGLARDCPLNTLVLFTSYGALERTRRGLLESGVAEDRILFQAPGSARDALARRFRSGRGIVLLGTSSFWEGVDFPGDALKILVITRLPFAVPSEPLVEARCERLAAAGEDPFMAYMIPEAVLRFKQGFGRLIRGTGDEGLALFLDSRLVNKGYGQRFLRSLPAETRLCFDEQTFAAELHDWYISRPRPVQG